MIWRFFHCASIFVWRGSDSDICVPFGFDGNSVAQFGMPNAYKLHEYWMERIDTTNTTASAWTTGKCSSNTLCDELGKIESEDNLCTQWVHLSAESCCERNFPISINMISPEKRFLLQSILESFHSSAQHGLATDSPTILWRFYFVDVNQGNWFVFLLFIVDERRSFRFTVTFTDSIDSWLIFFSFWDAEKSNRRKCRCVGSGSLNWII